MKKALIVGILILLCLLPLAPAQAEMRGYEKGLGYEYVLLGSYPYEKDGTAQPVLWRVLDIKEGRALLLTEYVLDAKQVIFESDPKVIENHSFRRISSYAESDLYAWLNSEGLDTLLGQDSIRAALVEEPGLGLLYPLTQEDYLNEADYGFSKGQWGEELNAYPVRQAVCTPYAKAQGLYVEGGNGKSPYWCVAIKDPSGYKFGLVGHNGHISWGAYTNTKVAGLRLAVRLDLSCLALSGGTGAKNDPYTLTYTGAVPAGGAPEPEAGGQPQGALETEAVQTAKTEAVPSPAPEKTGVTLSFIGDCSIGDSVQYKTVENSYHRIIDEKGYGWPFSLVKPYLEQDDLTVANLEVVLTTKTRPRYPDHKYNLIADPDHVQALIEGSVEMVNTVNNHCMDFQDTGYSDMLATLDSAGVLRFGTVYPNNPDGHDDLGVVDVGDIRFGFVGFTYPQDSDQKRIANRIKKLREEEHCDVVVVSLHWGRETYMTPEPSQIAYAKQIISAGADMIWGHHPHVLQPIQFYQGKPILYSTGNFTFGTMSKVDPSTGIFQVTYERVNGQVQLKRLQVIACETQGSPDYRPMPLEDPAAQQAVFAKLVMKKQYNNVEDPPASFLESGIIRFENGQMLP